MPAKTTEEPKSKDAAESSADSSKAKPAGLKSALISPIITAVVLGAVGFGLAYFVVPMRMMATAAAPSTAAAPAPSTNGAPTPDAAAATSDGKEKTGRTPAELAASGGKPVTKFTIEEVTVNIADTKGNRFVRAGVYFEAEPPVLEELEANRARMIDTLGQVLSTKTLDDLTSPNIRGNLRQELLGIINPTLKAGRVDNVYFTDLLVQ